MTSGYLGVSTSHAHNDRGPDYTCADCPDRAESPHTLSWDETKALLTRLLDMSDDEAGDVLTDASNHGYMRVWGGQYRARVDHAGDSGFTFTVVSVRRRRA
jgi:hypothetical protein